MWHFEPSPDDPDTVFAGVEDAGALPLRRRRRRRWSELPALRTHATGADWQPGAGGLCLHTIIIDPADARRMYVAISAAGAFRTRGRRRDVELATGGPAVRVPPRPGGAARPLRPQPGDAPVPPGHALHAEALGRLPQRRRRRLWTRGERRPAQRLRLPRRRARPRAGDGLRGPDPERRRALPAGGPAPRGPQPHRRRRVGAARARAAPARLLRQRPARRDGGRRARRLRRLLRHHRAARSTRPPTRATRGPPIAEHLPAVLSVEVQTIP